MTSNTAFFRDLLLPDRCCGCGTFGVVWCPACAATEVQPRATVLADGTTVFSRFDFDGAVRRTIIRWKEHGDRHAHALVRSWFAASLHALALPTSVLIVPVPSSPAADRRRGRAVLAEMLFEVSGSTSQALMATRGREDQTGLNRTQRIRNLANCMSWRGDAGVDVLIVDDVMTTGSTLLEAARAVKSAGARVAGACVLARPARRDSGLRVVDGIRLECQNHAIADESRGARQEVDDGRQ